MIKHKATAYTSIWMELGMKESGGKISSMVRAKRSGQMELSMKESTLKEKSMELDSFSGQMGPVIMDSSLTIILMEKANTYGQIKESIMESGRVIRCTATESLLGLMEGDTKEDMLMIKRKVKGPLNGKIESNIYGLWCRPDGRKYIGGWFNGK